MKDQYYDWEVYFTNGTDCEEGNTCIRTLYFGYSVTKRRDPSCSSNLWILQSTSILQTQFANISFIQYVNGTWKTVT